MHEICKFKSDPIDGIYIYANDKDITKMKALIIGPKDTPYEGGYFFFSIDLSNRYPINPPNIQIMHYASGTRFHPNLYEEGKICLSILNTWGDHEWSPILTVQKVLITIQGLMDNNPISHEPSFSRTLISNPDAVVYKTIVEHEVIKYAIFGQVKNPMFPEFQDIVRKHFKENKNKIKERLLQQSHKKQQMQSFHMTKVVDFGLLLSEYKNNWDY
jgi:ubiquitin-conjugating enzyme E2 Z